MNPWLTALIEIIKISVPALVVFITVRAILKTYLDKRYQSELLEFRKSQRSTTLPLQLQAYERLSLFCERIELPNMLLRIRPEGKTNAQLRVELMLTIQQEYEHNITQQVYVSDSLWQIIRAAKEDAINTVSLAAEQVEPKSEASKLTETIFSILSQRGGSGPDTALKAIKKEASILFG